MNGMNDINGIPITFAPPSPRPGVGIAEIAVELERDRNIAILNLREPAVVRAAAFWLQAPTVLGAASMRATEKIAQPLLFVECDPAGEMREHVFVFVPSNAPFEPRDGYRAEYRASAIQGGVGCIHVYELVKVTP